MTSEARYEPEPLLQLAARVRRVARALVADENEAQDLEQATWRRALEHPDTPPNGPWLSAIARNLARTGWRAAARRRAREEHVARERAPIPTPSETLEREELRRRVVEAVLALDDPWRTTLVLHYLEERGLRDVAESMGVSLETARTRVKRGLELLRGRMRRELGGSWALVLARGFDLELSATAAVSFFPGAFVMGLALKLALAAAAAAIAVLAFLRFGVDDSARPLAAEGSAAPARMDEPPSSRHSPREGMTIEREATPMSRSSMAGVDAPSDTAPAAASLTVRAVWGADGAPAVDVGIELRSQGDRAPDLQTRRARTDSNGRARFDDVAPGSVMLRSDRGVSWAGQLVRGAREHAELVIERGVRLHGEVVDELDRPVVGAQIWIDHQGVEGRGFPVASSDSRGRFDVQGFARDAWFFVGARAPGRAATRQEAVRHPRSEEVRVRLVFAGPGATVEVQVRDALGAPVADASAYLGESAGGERVVLEHLGPPPPIRARTDARGVAVLEGARLGRMQLHVRAPDHAPWSAELDLGRDASVAVLLEPAVVLRGRVLDSKGAPVPAARVQIGSLGSFVSTSSKSAHDGRFALHGLAPGAFEVEVVSKRHCRLARTFEALPGTELDWDAVLPAGAVLRGRVVAPGVELAGWQVECSSSLGGVFVELETVDVAADGRFEFHGCADRPVDLQVRRAEDDVFVLAQLLGVLPGPDEVSIEIDPALCGSVRLVGSVVDERGAPLSGVELHPFAFELGPSPVERADALTGRFELGPYPAAEWGLIVLAPDRPRLRLPPRRVAPGETHDFGAVAVGSGGVLAVSIVRERGVEHDELELALTPLDHQLAVRFRGRAPQARSAPLAAGSYEVVGYSADGLSVALPVELRDGVETPLELRLRPAARWRARVLDADGRPWSGFVEWRATDDSGAVVAQGASSITDGELAPSTPLPAGALEVLVRAQDRALSAKFTLFAELPLRTAAPPPELTLR